MRTLIVLVLAAVSAWGQFYAPSNELIFYPQRDFHSSVEKTCTLNDVLAQDQVSIVFRMPVSGTALTHMLVRTGTVTSAQALSVGLQTVSTSTGNPDGAASPYGGSTAGSIPTPATNTLYEVELGTPATPVKDDVVAAAIYFTGTAGNLQVRLGADGPTLDVTAHSICTDATVPTKGYLVPAMWVKIDGTWYPVGPIPAIYGASSTAYHSGTTYNEYGNRIVASAYTGRAIGAYFYVNLSAANTFQVKLYDSTNTEIATSVTVDSDQLAVTNGKTHLVRFTTPVNIIQGQQYSVMLKALAASPSINFGYSAPGTTAADMQFASSGTNIYGAAANGASWVTYDTRRYYISLVLDRIFVGGGSFAY